MLRWLDELSGQAQKLMTIVSFFKTRQSAAKPEPEKEAAREAPRAVRTKAAAPRGKVKLTAQKTLQARAPRAANQNAKQGVELDLGLGKTGTDDDADFERY